VSETHKRTNVTYVKLLMLWPLVMTHFLVLRTYSVGSDSLGL